MHVLLSRFRILFRELFGLRTTLLVGASFCFAHSCRVGGGQPDGVSALSIWAVCVLVSERWLLFPFDPCEA